MVHTQFMVRTVACKFIRYGQTPDLGVGMHRESIPDDSGFSKILQKMGFNPL